MPFARRSALVVASAMLAAVVVCAAPADASTPSSSPDGGGVVRVQAAEPADIAEAATARVAAMSTREKAASVVMGHIPTTDAASLHDYMARTGIGGFILMGANIPATEQELRGETAALTIDPALPPLIAVDQEGGDVSRLPWDGFPASVALKAETPSAVESAFAGRAALVQRAGIGVNFGIVADVTDDRSMFIYRRALGTTPESGAANVTAAVHGEAGQTLSTLKHFPGHGAAPGDSHGSIPSTSMPQQEWAATDALPFAAGIDAGARILMFGHLAYTAVDAAPASLSPTWHEIARRDLGFTGVAITDDLGMLEASGVPSYRDPVGNAVAALAAGNDMVLSVMFTTADTAPRIVDGIVAAVDAGTLSADRLDDAAGRVVQLRLELAAEGRGLVPCADCAPAE
ncbi:glycoside hydrolase family 3 N-terminal domain-containing protein [Microbacterium ulmi]|uniref:Glycoside hydrolase family 3 protein n=1 Tax=Microbacterium ulmi TaxID=179095 RepID=A0A7Y2Q008_9MICO|nr:glycoside hydrolase family 3 N-terminal domain-containing protein [Microbacterium ulmi]NII71103.1 beta-N-acetylhexosaminidase [Microbacterium ulmi]NNH02410.1 glycoside hydrolase family 3 protein [Microbacterium ulmi]